MDEDIVLREIALNKEAIERLAKAVRYMVRHLYGSVDIIRHVEDILQGTM